MRRDLADNRSYIDAGRKEGATVSVLDGDCNRSLQDQIETGGKRLGDKGYFIEPTIFGNVNENMKIMQEGTFTLSRTATMQSDICPSVRPTSLFQRRDCYIQN